VNIEVRHSDDIIIVKPGAEIIGPASREFRDIVAEQLTHASDAPKFLFDLTHVQMMDSTALGVLMGTQITIAPSGRLGLIHLNSRIRTLIAKSKLETVFEQFDSEAQAIDELRDR
jgi:anti-anti-sigma factor